jgi:ADP-ribose pyrophosphatase YjhB (NUDIX family)
MARAMEIARAAKSFYDAWQRRGEKGTYLAMHERDSLFDMLKEPIEDTPVVAVAAVIIRDGEFLMSRRTWGFCKGQWQFPGGGLKWGKSFDDSVRDEVEEETGMTVERTKFITLYNRIIPEENHHYVVAFLRVWASGEPKTMEPDKNTDWEWVPIRAVRSIDALEPIKWLVRDYGPDFT